MDLSDLGVSMDQKDDDLQIPKTMPRASNAITAYDEIPEGSLLGDLGYSYHI